MPVATKLFLFHPDKNAAVAPLATPFDFEKVIASDDFKGALSFWRNFKYYGNRIRQNAILNGEKVIALIEAELK